MSTRLFFRTELPARTTRRAGLLVPLLLFTALASPTLAQDQAGWQYWTAADGMLESYSRTIGLSPSGAVAVRHGVMKKMDVLDGYTVRTIPEPREGLESGFVSATPVYTVASGEAWTVEERALKQYRWGTWIVRATEGPGERMIAAVPVDARRIIVLFAHAVAEFDAVSGGWKTLVQASATTLGRFRRIARGFDGDFWVAAEAGLGRLEAAGNRWTAARAAGYEAFDSPLAGEAGEVLASAFSTRSRTNVVVRLKDGRYEQLFASKKSLRGWRGLDGVMWILEGATLWKIVGATKEAVDKRGPLSGVIYDVATEPGGGFWLASSTGVAHYSPPIWRTPAAVKGIDQPVHAIAEDREGRLWFAATEYLLELDGSIWRRHALPDNFRTQTNQTAGLARLADGRIAFTALEAGTIQHLMAFDPRTGGFESIRHPEGRSIMYIWPHREGSVWVHTMSPCRIDEWDGRSFVPRPDLKLEPLCGKIRVLYPASDGSVWIGTTAMSGAVYRPLTGRLELIDRMPGYPEAAVYTIAEAAGRILAGGREALAEFDGARWRVLRTRMDAVRSIAESADGTLWIAAGSGVYRRNRSGAWLVNGEADGLPSDIAYDILQDRQGRIWAGTSRGLSRHFAAADTGVPRASIAASNATDATPEGNVSIGFSGLDRWKVTTADRLTFSHRRDGGAWSEFGPDTTAALLHVASGSHQLEIRAMDRNGNIGPTETFAFTVAYPWYRQAGFFAIAGASALAIGVLIGFAVFQYRQLARAKVAAELANRSKTAFLANMSHEIRTPMNAIIGMTELAADIATSAEQKEYLNIVRNSSSSLLALLNDILDLSKVEAGKLELVRENFDLRRCLQDALSTLKLRALQKSLALRLATAPDVPQFVRGDNLRLRQVLLNLLGNAIKFTDEGEVLVRVARAAPTGAAAACAAHDGEANAALTLHVTVADTGPGVAPEKQSIIFAPFEQGNQSRTRLHGGTGLGLAISRQLVRLMRGAIWLESPWIDEETGTRVAGTAIHFTVELEPGHAPRPDQAVAEPSASRPLRVLIAEDNVVNQLLASRFVEKLGHTPVIASSGDEAVGLFDRESPDLVLMDLEMPVMDGLDATSAIRDRERSSGRRTPIVALTAHALQGYREDCLRAGMDDYITKPIRIEELAAAIERNCATAAGRPSDVAGPVAAPAIPCDAPAPESGI